MQITPLYIPTHILLALLLAGQLWFIHEVSPGAENTVFLVTTYGPWLILTIAAQFLLTRRADAVLWLAIAGAVIAAGNTAAVLIRDSSILMTVLPYRLPALAGFTAVSFLSLHLAQRGELTGELSGILTPAGAATPGAGPVHRYLYVLTTGWVMALMLLHLTDLAAYLLLRPAGRIISGIASELPIAILLLVTLFLLLKRRAAALWLFSAVALFVVVQTVGLIFDPDFGVGTPAFEALFRPVFSLLTAAVWLIPCALMVWLIRHRELT